MGVVGEDVDVVAQFTTTGTMLAGSAVYDPWGAPLARAGLVGSLGYQSGWTDPGTGRVNMGSRWYNPTTGQFDTRDAASNSPTPDTAAANRYAYASANPLTNVDPAGTWSLRGLARSVGNTIARVATAVVNTVIQVVSAVVNAVVNAVSAVWNAAVGLVRSAVSWAQNTGAGRWVSQQAAAARTWAAQKAEQARAAAKIIVAAARQKAQVEVAKAKRAYAETRQKLADAYQASATWVADHKSLLIEIAAIGVGIGAGLLCGAITLGVGAAACMIGASALINLTKDAAQGNIHNWGDGFASFGTGALQGLGGAAGGLVGGKLAAITAGKLGGIASRLGSRMLLGAIEGGAGDLTGQLLTTGKVDWTAVAMSAAMGAATGAKSGAAKPGGKPDADVDTPGPQKSSGGDDTPDTPSPSKSSGGDETRGSAEAKAPNCNSAVETASVDDLVKMGTQAGKGGLSPAGRAYQKHVDPAKRTQAHIAKYDVGPLTSNADRTLIGNYHVEDIMTNPNVVESVSHSASAHYGGITRTSDCRVMSEGSVGVCVAAPQPSRGFCDRLERA